MSEEPRVNGLVAWVLGTFHTTVFALALLLLLYPRGGFGATLQGLSTLSGLAIFVALWATTVFTTRRALSGLDWLDDDAAQMAIFFRRALRWGGVNGMLFLAELGVILLLNAALTARDSLTSPALTVTPCDRCTACSSSREAATKSARTFALHSQLADPLARPWPPNRLNIAVP